MYKKVIFGFFFFSLGILQAQNSLDSLKFLLKQAKKENRIIELLNEVAFDYLKVNVDSAIFYTSTLDEYSQTRGNIHGIAMANDLWGNIYSAKGEGDSALHYFEGALFIWKRINERKNYCVTIGNIATLYEEQGYYTQSLAYYFEILGIWQSIKKYESPQDSIFVCSNVANTLHNIGMVECKLRTFDKAIQYLEQSLKLSRELSSQADIIRAYISLSDAYISLKDYDCAIEYGKQAIDANEETNIPIFSIVNHVNLCAAFLGKKQIDSAEKYLQFAENLYAQNNVQQFWEAVIWKYQGKISFEKKLYYKAENKLLAAIAYFRRISARQQVIDIALDLSQLYDVLQDYENAYRYLKLNTLTQDSLLNQEKRNAINEMQIKHEMDIKAQEYELSLKEQEVQKLALSSRNAWMLAIIVVLVLLAGGIFFVFYRNRTQMKQESLRLEQQLLRSQMNPHFIFNCLSAIQRFINIGDDYAANMYLAKFSTLLRSILELSKNPILSLAQEIDFLENYLALEKTRFNENFEYKISKSSEIHYSQVQIPFMILQPYVENALKHGFAGRKEEKNILEIRFSKEENRVICEIEDNGMGYDKSQQLKAENTLSYPPRGMEITSNRINVFNQVATQRISVDILNINDEKGNVTGTLVKVSIWDN